MGRWSKTQKVVPAVLRLGLFVLGSLFSHSCCGATVGLAPCNASLSTQRFRYLPTKQLLSLDPKDTNHCWDVTAGHVQTYPCKKAADPTIANELFVLSGKRITAGGQCVGVAKAAAGQEVAVGDCALQQWDGLGAFVSGSKTGTIQLGSGSQTTAPPLCMQTGASHLVPPPGPPTPAPPPAQSGLLGLAPCDASIPTQRWQRTSCGQVQNAAGDILRPAPTLTSCWNGGGSVAPDMPIVMYSCQNPSTKPPSQIYEFLSNGTITSEGSSGNMCVTAEAAVVSAGLKYDVCGQVHQRWAFNFSRGQDWSTVSLQGTSLDLLPASSTCRKALAECWQAGLDTSKCQLCEGTRHQHFGAGCTQQDIANHCSEPPQKRYLCIDSSAPRPPGFSEVQIGSQQIPTLPWAGYGAISGGGGDSRFLAEYPEPQRSNILDLLFTPNFGMGLRWLKIEIGGDTQSTMGTEASHMRAQNDTAPDNCLTRGYEGWLAREAVKRFPALIVQGLPWGVPAWVGNQQGYYHGEDLADYLVSWLQCMNHTLGRQVDLLGTWNEKANQLDPTWVIKFRKRLDSLGLTTGIIVPEDHWDDSFMAVLAGDAELRASIAGVGYHYGGPSQRRYHQQLDGWGLPYWTTETSADLSSVFLSQETPGFLHWNLATCNYISMGYETSGNMLCDQPWTGHYNLTLNGGFWRSAHYGRFVPANNGWRVARLADSLHNRSCATCKLSEGTSVLTFFNATDFSCIFSGSISTNTSLVLHGSLAARLSEPTSTVELWTSASANVSFAVGLVRLATLPVVNGRIELDAALFSWGGTHYTVTSLKGTRSSLEVAKLIAPVPAWQPFPSEYRDDFSTVGTTQGSLPKHFSDQGGVFEMVLAGGGRKNGVLSQQVAEENGVNRWCANPDPVTVVGNEKWRRTTACVEAWAPSAAQMASSNTSSVYVKLCVRAGATTGSHGSVTALCLSVFGNRTWTLGALVGQAMEPPRAVTSGTLKPLIKTAGWRRLCLNVSDALTLSGSVDGQRVGPTNMAEFVRGGPNPCYPSGPCYEMGMVALGSGWHDAYFDNLAIAGHESSAARQLRNAAGELHTNDLGAAPETADADAVWSDGHVSLRFASKKGSCLTEAIVSGQGEVLSSPLTLGMLEGEESWVACATPAVQVECLYNSSEILRLHTVEIILGAGRLETFYSYDSSNSTLGVVALFEADHDFLTTQAKQPYENHISVEVNVTGASLLSQPIPFIQDGVRTPQARCGFRTVGLAGAVGLRWDRPKMTACSRKNLNEIGEHRNASVLLQLVKHGFTPAAGELWRLDYALTLDSAASKPFPVDECNTAAPPPASVHVGADHDVMLPPWLLPAGSIDKSQWWPGDEHKLEVLRSLLPRYQVPLMASNVSGCPTRFFPMAGKNGSTGAPIPPSAPFCQTFDGPTAAIAMVRLGLRSQASDAIDAFSRTVSADGSISDEFDMRGEVQNKGTLVIAPAELILAVWSYWSRYGAGKADDAAALVRWLPSVERSARWLISRADHITGWTYHSEDSFAPASAAVNGLTAAWYLCRELAETARVHPSMPKCSATPCSYLRAARRASAYPQGLSSRNASQMRSAYAWFSPLKGAVARDEYIARWYASTWSHFTGSGGARNNDGGSFAAGETSELGRSVFFNLTEQRRLMYGMYSWAWIDSMRPGVGGFIDTENRWIPQGYSDRALWSMAEPAIYLTTNFTDVAQTVIEPRAPSPIFMSANQTVTAVVQERRGHGVTAVSIVYNAVSAAGGRTTRSGPFAMQAGSSGGAQRFTWRHVIQARSLATPDVTVGTDPTLTEDAVPIVIRYLITVRGGDGVEAGQASGSFVVVPTSSTTTAKRHVQQH